MEATKKSATITEYLMSLDVFDYCRTCL